MVGLDDHFGRNLFKVSEKQRLEKTVDPSNNTFVARITIQQYN